MEPFRRDRSRRRCARAAALSLRGLGERYLDSDAASRTRSPAAVKVPSGAFQDIFEPGRANWQYDPGLVRAPIAIIRGEWDAYCTDADAGWRFGALKASPEKHDIKIGLGNTSDAS